MLSCWTHRTWARFVCTLAGVGIPFLWGWPNTRGEILVEKSIIEKVESHQGEYPQLQVEMLRKSRIITQGLKSIEERCLEHTGKHSLLLLNSSKKKAPEGLQRNVIKLATRSLQCKYWSGARILINRVKFSSQASVLTRVISKENLGIQALQSCTEIPGVSK